VTRYGIEKIIWRTGVFSFFLLLFFFFFFSFLQFFSGLINPNELVTRYGIEQIIWRMVFFLK
jgi:hypothetical protein